MKDSGLGSLTKEPPLWKLDEILQSVTPEMAYEDLVSVCAARNLQIAAAILRKRFLLVDESEDIKYDRFLSLVASDGMSSALVRKVMYFTWAFRDSRVRRFICERIADTNGKWHVKEIRNKSNSDFFLEWFGQSGSVKTRSNIERFLIDSGILDDKTSAVRLGLEDNWLQEAVLVASQHERDLSRRSQMVFSPHNFLIDQGWNGLANATVRELRASLDYTVVSEIDVLEDRSEVGPPSVSKGRKWTPAKFPATLKGTTMFGTNPVLRERARKSHQVLERILASHAVALSYTPMSNEHIDLYFKTSSGRYVIAEVKSCHSGNFHIQVRLGVSQLLEYRYRYKDVVKQDPVLLLVIETRPDKEKWWLIGYLASIGITLAWKEPKEDRLLTATPIPQILSGIVFADAS